MTPEKRRRELAILRREWGDCRRCPLGENAFRHVLYEIGFPLPTGETRADILFIGEAPGRSEDAIGRPFIGVAGALLRETITAADPSGLILGFSNLLACRPVGDDGKDRPPQACEVGKCHPRLETVIRVLDPWAVVGLGRVPETFLPPIIRNSGWEGARVWFKHPSYINRTGKKSSPYYPEYLEGFCELFDNVRLQKSSCPDRHPIEKEKVAV
jgi:uracil-DNA glycosylase family 4